ncbi:FliH/SctL family protein [Cellulomonas sp. Marseille-Q8402]
MSPDTRAFTQAYAGTTTADVSRRAEGFAAGYAAGYAAGAREAARAAQAESVRVQRERAEADARRATEHADALAVLAAAARAAADRSAPVLAAAEATLHAAGLDLAAAVLGTELADAPTAARAALRRVREQDPAREVHTVRLHPRDLAAVRAALAADVPDVLAGLPDLTGVELVADPALAPGDAVGEFPEGYLDARIGAALDRARTALADGGAPA